MENSFKEIPLHLKIPDIFIKYEGNGKKSKSILVNLWRIAKTLGQPVDCKISHKEINNFRSFSLHRDQIGLRK